jgi:hypothetical protein
MRTLRGKDLVVKPGRSRRYHCPATAASTIAALLACAIRSSAPSSPVSAVTPGTQTRHLDPHRPGLRSPPRHHADPLP